MKKLISIVTPVYNEAETLDAYHTRMSTVLDGLSDRYDFEIVLTDNRSTDGSFEKIKELSKKDPRIRAYRFSRNFGYQRSILTGYQNARGDAAIEFDCDLQDPPELLEKFLTLWEAGNEIVYGIREKRKESRLLEFSRKTYYRFLNAISELELPRNAGDFMLIDRKVLDRLTHMTDPSLYLRGTIFSLGFERVGIPYHRDARQAGSTKFPLSRMLDLAGDGVFSQSMLPLKLSGYFAIILAFTTLVFLIVFIAAKLFADVDWPAGFAMTMAIAIISIMLNAFFFAILGAYIGRVYKLLQKENIVIIDEIIDRK
ncbi:MAG: glycosyltransferase family 2 protein [Fimbriimonadaceae bacterium]|nr:glycosyltransferase family 2 protein [Alphaproteobacteria bacterium]